ncbi:acyltransferase [Chamaesiphon sp. OTE_75_metabat_556]|uniref:acyltransferase family protein n=1 Tax=Chamaesiphon sp. OTE_75_metabat_556 TaxID=2964692 RepID=UPI00286B2567|nr:acyltransferase [Chamaesiphon sp. OTE_75_metabat_556]
MSEQSASKRIVNLDLIRAVAIVAVVVYHTVQMVGRDGFVAISKYTHVGHYGVDLFFVLSGFLIGQLYWREQIDRGHVDIPRFILRRLLRTYPAYAIAMVLAFIPVWLVRHQAFDFGYLFFLQNYYDRLPFFLVSWSLCIEEHFYIFLPFILYTIRRLKPSKVLVTLLALSSLSLILRVMLVKFEDNLPFGYYLTATHFRFEGLILGVAAAHIFTYFPSISQWLARPICNFSIVALIALLVPIAPALPTSFLYYVGPSLVAIIFCLLVLSLASSKPIRWGEHQLVKILAMSSYSIYLTHALVIHLVLLVTNKLGMSAVVTWLAMVGAILAVGYIFYLVVETSALRWRDKIVPKVPKQI